MHINIGAEVPVPSTPFTFCGGVGFTDSNIATTGYGFTDYKVVQQLRSSA